MTGWIALTAIQPVFASPALDALQKSARDKQLSNHRQWHRLLHYSRNLMGRYQSEIDDPSFFTSPQGRRDPQAELDATLAAFFQAVPPAESDIQHPICRYPARFAWLKEELSIQDAELPKVSCSRFEKWREQLHPESVALVMASSYMNNPSSMYGHTFLLLRKGENGKNALLDYAVNFAADLEKDNGVLYTIKGLMGGYHGRFSSFPYYIKVQEYSNMESRDLWEYDLKLEPAAIRRLLEHLWEMGNVRIPYYFFNKNCSYYLMPILEVALPAENFKGPFIFKAIPVDTVRGVVQQKDVLTKKSRRPSQASQMLSKRALLTKEEIRLAEDFAAIPAKTVLHETGIDPNRRALVLDAAMELLRYRTGFHAEQPEPIRDKEHDLMIARSKIQTPSPSSPAATGGGPINDGSPTEALGDDGLVSPDAGHASGRIGLSYGFTNRSHFEELSLRPAIHDQDDPPEGYLPGSRLEMFNTRLRYDNDRTVLYLQEFSIIDMVSITPWDRWIHPPSWKVQTGFNVANDLDHDPEHSLYYGLHFGPGYSAWVPGSKKMLVYGMGEMALQLGHVFDDFVRFGGGPSGGILITPWRYWRGRLQASYFPYATGGTSATTRIGFTQSFTFTKDFELRAKLERQNSYKEVLLSLMWFL